MESLRTSYDQAEELTRREARNFFHTFRFLEPERRRSIYAVYAFSRRVDDAVDAVEEEGIPEPVARRDLARLESFLREPLPDDWLVPALRNTIERFHIPLHPFEELIAGMAMDLEKNRYATWEDLYQYCWRAASTVGLICVEIFGYEGQASEATRDAARARVAPPAEALGIAMQLTNILRDVTEDLARGRIYLPQEDLSRFGVREDQLEGRVSNQAFRDLIRFEVERARDAFRTAAPLYELVLPESRYCPLLLERFYSRILDRIESQDYDVLRKRPRLTRKEKLGMVANAWLQSKRGS